MSHYRGCDLQILAPFRGNQLCIARLSRAASYCRAFRQEPRRSAGCLEATGPVCPTCTACLERSRGEQIVHREWPLRFASAAM
jgi:hypothetical protein